MYVVHYSKLLCACSKYDNECKRHIFRIIPGVAIVILDIPPRSWVPSNFPFSWFPWLSPQVLGSLAPYVSTVPCTLLDAYIPWILILPGSPDSSSDLSPPCSCGSSLHLNVLVLQVLVWLPVIRQVLVVLRCKWFLKFSGFCAFFTPNPLIGVDSSDFQINPPMH